MTGVLDWIILFDEGCRVTELGGRISVAFMCEDESCQGSIPLSCDCTYIFRARIQYTVDSVGDDHE